MTTTVKKIKHLSHKSFGCDSFIVDEQSAGQVYFGRVRNLASKVIHPDNYKGTRGGKSDWRTRREKLNADEIKLSKEEQI